MLRFADISFAFGDAPAIDKLNLTINPGELAVLLGRSGCGKTTALRLAAGLIQPTGGQLINTFTRTASVFQEPRLLPWATALDNAAFGLKALGVDREHRRLQAAQLLRQFGINEADFDKRPWELSGGMAQRVAFARALAIKPQLVLMDEPFSALDAGLRREMQTIVRDAAKKDNVAVLFVTHDVNEAVRLADRIFVLSAAPARAVAELTNYPPASLAEAYQAGSALLQHPIVADALTT
ncbi:ATP-binding cassette domain-containing protein [Hyphomicrobium sp. D-2]|uniref:ABC transporter ATP-binding protein n=1 Tax=Hyphomicrobium sp. D-2 TaxID=3041621 RepID=UPI0024545C47|nr:ATP-binding cassette domain-containing protein [Hyphomicrobium sp. D-2]MDH4982406.1 ATP-binding cassette domain-containing protein [Hyphomicrobium sp. D-2]